MQEYQDNYAKVKEEWKEKARNLGFIKSVTKRWGYLAGAIRC